MNGDAPTHPKVRRVCPACQGECIVWRRVSRRPFSSEELRNCALCDGLGYTLVPHPTLFTEAEERWREHKGWVR